MIKIYTTPTCPYCEMVKEYFNERKVGYETFDVSNDENAQKEMFAKSHQMGVPVIDINGMIIIGFNRGEIDKALNKQ
jgi:glutaredoxin 3